MQGHMWCGMEKNCTDNKKYAYRKVIDPYINNSLGHKRNGSTSSLMMT